MQWQLIVILVIAIPVVLFPAAYVWYINVGGLAALAEKARAKRAARTEKGNINQKVLKELEYEKALTEKLEKYPW